jgi:tRNA threonylcarbamoyladenosine biosynthesis protein TsaB
VLLAIDTATRSLGIALYDGAQVLAETSWFGGGQHTVALAPEVALLIRRVGRAPTDLSLVAVAQGPGSYTGLRVGIAFAKGLCLAHRLPIVGVPTLDILAQGQPGRSETMIALLEAGRGRIAWAAYRWDGEGWEAIHEARVMSWDELLSELQGKSYLCGEIGPQRRSALASDARLILASPAVCVRRPAVLAEIAWRAAREGRMVDPGSLEPIYLDAQERAPS